MARIAVGSVQREADHHIMTTALLQALTVRGVHVQAFYSRGCHGNHDLAHAITGFRRRHLDSWLMTPSVAAGLLYSGCVFADMALVEGPYDMACDGSPAGGSLDTLCDCLAMPRLIILDAARLTSGHFPELPPADGVLLDNVANVRQLCRLQTCVEALSGIPVLGSLGEIPCLRRLIDATSSLTPTGVELYTALGHELSERLDFDRILELAFDHTAATVVPEFSPRSDEAACKLHVAIALDEAFGCFFPDTLDVLEDLSATVSVFSPLDSDRLPPDVDVVYVGDGHPECFARALADNICMKQAIAKHVWSGGRVYAEGGGLAYLTREMTTAAGDALPMVGVLPTCVRYDPSAAAPRPCELQAHNDCWLLEAGYTTRGYVKNDWVLDPDASSLQLASGPDNTSCLIGNYQVVASQANLHFASQPSLVDRFFHPTVRSHTRTATTATGRVEP